MTQQQRPGDSFYCYKKSPFPSRGGPRTLTHLPCAHSVLLSVGLSVVLGMISSPHWFQSPCVAEDLELLLLFFSTSQVLSLRAGATSCFMWCREMSPGLYVCCTSTLSIE